jgi:propionate CoA-transferase
MTTLMPGPSGDTTRPDFVISADQAARLVPSGATVAVGGSGSLLQVPEDVLRAIGERFITDSTPVGLVVVHTMGLGNHEGRGLDHLSRVGLAARFIGSHFVLSSRQQELIAANQVEAIGLPAGTITLLYREIAARRPGLFTDIGLETHVDPRYGWGCMNSCTVAGLSELVVIKDKEWLFYPRFDLDVAIIRATAADSDGNLSMDDEAAFSDNLAIAQAAHNSGGIVIAEVKRILSRGAVPASRVRVPGILVDHVVVTSYGHQTPITVFNPSRTGFHPNEPVEVGALPLDHRKVIARRAAMELQAGQLVNLGVGMANGMSYVALEEGFIDDVTLTVEQGIFGGLPGVGLDSGTALNPEAIIDMSSQFDLYDGGALDFAGLGFAQIDASGNVNVNRVGSVPIGPGGFIDISQKAATVVFCGNFRGGGSNVRVSENGVQIVADGRYSKFVEQVDAISFNAKRALRRGQRVLYVTERAVFQLGEEGLELIEIAPGIDLVHDVLEHMPFTPQMHGRPRWMDARIFSNGVMGWRPAGRVAGSARVARKRQD